MPPLPVSELNLVKLPEDATLSGFTPLMSNPQDSFYAEKTEDMEVAQVCLRIQKILFFGQVFLCGLETPVLKLQKNEFGVSEYVSLVETSSTSSPNSPPEQVYIFLFFFPSGTYLYLPCDNNRHCYFYRVIRNY